MATTVTDIRNHLLLGVLKGLRKETISEFFWAISPGIEEKIIEVCGDTK